MRIGYLVSRHPATSHTFIRREIAALRRRGAEIHTFSIRRPFPEEVRSEADRRDLADTWYVLPVGAAALIREHLAALVRRPGPYLRTLRRALRHRLPGAREVLWASFYFAEAILLARELERREMRHLHTHFANSGADVGLLAACYLGIGWSLTLHGSGDFDSPRRGLLSTKIASSRFTVCVSHFGRAQALRVVDPSHWSKVFVSRCGLELAELPRRDRRSNERFRILCIGRLTPVKGHLGLLDAFAELLNEGVDAELRIVGDGPEKQRLERRIAENGLLDRCSMLGRMSANEVFRELESADLFVLSSFMEGLPVVLVEAMALGVPVIAPRLAGIPELVLDGQSGLLFTPAHWSELSQAMVRLAGDPEERSRLGKEGRQRVEAEFDIERAVEPLWQRLRDL